MVKQRWGCLYRLTNTINNRIYIGKTVNFKRRMSKHKYSKRKTYISRAIQKYGWENFKREIIIDNVPEEDLSGLEISYIETENTMAPAGYNLTKGGEGLSGFKHSAESIRKMHNGKYGYVFFEKQCNKWRAVGVNPKQKRIGLYFTKKKAEEALKRYNKTGERMEPDRTMRKRGTGSIHKRRKRYRAQLKMKKKSYTKTFGTIEECEEWFNSIKNKV